MNRIKLLSDLEFGSFRNALPGFSRKGLAVGAAYFLLLLAASLYLFRDEDSPHKLLASGVVLLFGLMMLFSLLHAVIFWLIRRSCGG